MPQSVLDRGADTILNMGAWNDSPKAPDLGLVLTDSLATTETFNRVLTVSTLVRSAMARGVDNQLLDIGAWQEPMGLPIPKIALYVPAEAPKVGPDYVLRFIPENYILGMYDLAKSAYMMEVYPGVAGDDFQDDFILFGIHTRYLMLMVWDHDVDIALTQDGTDELCIKHRSTGFLEEIATRGFKIRNSERGAIARYEITAME